MADGGIHRPAGGSHSEATGGGLVEWLQHLWKAIVRLLTGRGELERALLRGPHDAVMSKDVAEYFTRSRELADLVASLRTASEPDGDLAVRIITIKRIRTDRATFGTTVLPNLLACLTEIRGVRSLAAQLTRQAATPYTESPLQESSLLNIWENLKPDTPLTARISKQWEDIGFQGADPARDFRGMGVLGLEAIGYIAVRHNVGARQILAATDLPFKGYPFAITIIQIVDYALKLCLASRLDSTLIQGTSPPLTSDRLHAAFMASVAQLLFAFDEHWVRSKPKNLLDFPLVFASFRAVCDASLSRTSELPRAAGWSFAGSHTGEVEVTHRTTATQAPMRGGAGVGVDGAHSPSTPTLVSNPLSVASPTVTPGGT